jgi:SsrA-binding protein
LIQFPKYFLSKSRAKCRNGTIKLENQRCHTGRSSLILVYFSPFFDKKRRENGIEILKICGIIANRKFAQCAEFNTTLLGTGIIFVRSGLEVSGEEVVMSPKATGIKQITQNRKAFHDYFVLDRYEAGIELSGTEVKSIRLGTVNLKDSFCTVKDGELFLRGMHVSPYEKGNIFNRDPVRPRKLLMHKKEILKLHARVMQDGVALVPLSLYFKDSRVKVELGLCKGKKLYDKRDAAAERTAKRDIDRAIKQK